MGIAYTVQSGPGHHGIFASLSEGDSQRRMWLTIQVVLESSPHGQPRLFEITINGLEWEDGSGVSFNIRGNWRDTPTARSGEFHGYYHTKRRQGRLVFE